MTCGTSYLRVPDPEISSLKYSFTAEGTSAPTVVDDSDRSPLSENEELMKAWIYDSKKWQDVFTCKPYEYLSLVSQMKTPWFDRANGVWIEKEEVDETKKQETENANADVKAAKQAIANMKPKNDFEATITLDDFPY